MRCAAYPGREDRVGDGSTQHAQHRQLYEAFAPAEARRLAEKLEIHHTPKHGNWLNMAEIELSVLSRQCMEDCFESRKQLAARIAPWQDSRNQKKTGIDWRFTTDDARIKLKTLYPVI